MKLSRKQRERRAWPIAVTFIGLFVVLASTTDWTPGAWRFVVMGLCCGTCAEWLLALWETRHDP